MISLFQKSLDAKIATAILCVNIIAFSTLILSFNQLQTSCAEDVAGEISSLLSRIDIEGPDDQDQNFLERAKRMAEALPGALESSVFHKTVWISIASLVFIMLSMGLILHVIFLKPLKLINRTLQGSIRGKDRDLTARLNFKRKDEIGDLADSFDTFISNLDDIIMGIGNKTETVAASASEVFIISEQMDEESTDLSTGSSSVAAAAEEMNSSMLTVAAASEEASVNITMVADAAGQMQSNIAGIAENCETARGISGKAKEQVESAIEKVGHLGSAADEISNVTQVITDIAEQTNLLALNATIEAARAGEQGKGFAVVAGEIKNLASQTAEATGSIREKIEGIQRSANDTVEEVGSISQVISSVDEIVQDITGAIEDQSSTTTEVASNIEQASTGLSEVSENVAQSSQVASEIARDITRVDGVAAEMSVRASGMTDGAKDLDALSMDLRKMISIFMVSGGGKTKGPETGQSLKEVPDLMPWGPRFETSIPEIDDQHRELVRLVNLLHKSMRRQQGSRQMAEILKDLAQYTVFHFQHEEKLFKKYSYPDYGTHRDIHTSLVDQVAGFQKDFTDGKATVTMELMDFLKDWLKNHIMKTDMEYVPFLKERM